MFFNKFSDIDTKKCFAKGLNIYEFLKQFVPKESKDMKTLNKFTLLSNPTMARKISYPFDYETAKKLRNMAIDNGFISPTHANVPTFVSSTYKCVELIFKCFVVFLYLSYVTKNSDIVVGKIWFDFFAIFLRYLIHVKSDFKTSEPLQVIVKSPISITIPVVKLFSRSSQVITIKLTGSNTFKFSNVHNFLVFSIFWIPRRTCRFRPSDEIVKSFSELNRFVSSKISVDLTKESNVVKNFIVSIGIFKFSVSFWIYSNPRSSMLVLECIMLFSLLFIGGIMLLICLPLLGICFWVSGGAPSDLEYN